MAPLTTVLTALTTLTDRQASMPNPDAPNALWVYMVIALCVCIPISTIAFVLRCLARLCPKMCPANKKHQQWCLEDWCITVAFAGFLAECALVTIIIDDKGGVHQAELTLEELVKILFYQWIASFVYGPVVCATKVAILLMYNRLFLPQRQPRYLWVAIHAFITISCIFYAVTTFIKVFQCVPVRGAWSNDPRANCVDLRLLLCASGCFNLVTDVVVLIIPIHVVVKMAGLTWRRRLEIVLVFTIGAAGPVFSALGLVARLRMKIEDSSYVLPQVGLWALAEITTGIVCACLPLVPAICKRVLPRLRSANNITIEPAGVSGDRASKRQSEHQALTRQSHLSGVEPWRTPSLASSKPEHKVNIPCGKLPTPFNTTLTPDDEIQPLRRKSHRSVNRQDPSFEDPPPMGFIRKTVKVDQTEETMTSSEDYSLSEIDWPQQGQFGVSGHIWAEARKESSTV